MKDCKWCKNIITSQFHFKPYDGECKHEKAEVGYGFRRSWGCRGLGIYATCTDCKACSYIIDREGSTEQEEKWYLESIWIDGRWNSHIEKDQHEKTETP